MNSQIILNYEHPHIKTVINDNTFGREIHFEEPTGVRFLNVFTSYIGRDGVLLRFYDENALFED